MKYFAFKTLEYNSYELGRRPVLYPYMLQQMLRYVKGDRVIKSNFENLQNNSLEIASLNYPFILKKLGEDDSYQVCGTKNCFENTENINKINDIITKTFKGQI